MLLGEEHGIDSLLDASKLPRKKQPNSCFYVYVRVCRLASGSWCNTFRNSIHWSIDPINLPSQKQLPHRLKRCAILQNINHMDESSYTVIQHIVFAASLHFCILSYRSQASSIAIGMKMSHQYSFLLLSLLFLRISFSFYRWIPRPSRLSPLRTNANDDRTVRDEHMHRHNNNENICKYTHDSVKYTI